MSTVKDNKYKTENLITSALCLALCLVLPFLTGQIHSIGNMLCPMHIPVMICGLLCGRKLGAATGFIAPLLRSVLFGMPAMYPGAVAMAFELATYGFTVALVHDLLRGKMKHICVIYCSLIASMIAGRIVYGIVRFICLGLFGTAFSLPMWISIEFATAWPGIIAQLIIIPPIVKAIQKNRS